MKPPLPLDPSTHAQTDPQERPAARRTAFVLNEHAGSEACRDWLKQARPRIEAVAAGAPIRLVADGEQISAAVREALALGCDAVVAGGGDGTLNAVASQLVATPVAFGVLPLGTLNHFAKDLGLPLDADEALQVIEAGHTSQVDVGEVNGHLFLNNSSLGLYPDIVLDRQRQQSRLGRGKWTAFAWALWSALRRYPFMSVRLTVDGQSFAQRTPFVFIGNNAYQMQGFQIGQRATLRDGMLSVYVAHRTGRWRLLRLGLRAWIGRLRQSRDFRAFLTEELRIDTHHAWLRVANDGELCRLATPLHYRIRAGALRVITPAPVAGAGP